MRRIILLFILLYSPLLFAKGKHGKTRPKIDTSPVIVTNEDSNNDGIVWTTSAEVNIYDGTGYINPVIELSTANGWDIQIASYNGTLYGGGAQNYEWDTYINIAKSFDISNNQKIILGTQNGMTLFSSPRQLHNVNYGLYSLNITPTINIHGGPYWANKALTTTTDYFGFTTGFSIDLTDKITLAGDYFNGHNNVSGATVNTFFKVHPKGKVYFGVGVPETDSGNEFYGIVGFILTSQ